MKKIISVFLAVLMIAGCMTISFSASAEATTFAVTGVKEPKVGENPDTSGAGLAVEGFNDYTIERIKYCEGTEGTSAYVGKFKVGYVYRVIITLAFNNGESDPVYSSINKVTVNGKEATYSKYMGYIDITYTFDVLGIEKVDITGVQEPKIGETTLNSTNIQVAGIDNCSVESVSFYEDGSNTKFVGNFKEGVAYRVVITLSFNDGENDPYYRGMTQSTVVTVNGKAAAYTKYMGFVDISYTFDALQAEDPQPEPQPENLCKWCGKVHEGFFQKIIGFFHNILAAIFGAKY